jgi:tetratricopeptide (TPR) repeat protein
MNKKVIPFIFLNLFSLALFAQQKDSRAKKQLRYLECRSHNVCSADERDYFHRDLIERFQHIEKNYPSCMTADDFNQLGKEFFYLNQFDSAMYYYRIAIRKRPNGDEIINNIGTVCFMQQQYDSAMFYFSKAHSLNDTAQDYVNNISSCHGAKGNLKSCIQYAEISLKMNRDDDANIKALNNLILTYQTLKNKSKVLYYKKKLDLLVAKDSEYVDCECTKYLPECEL